MAAKKEDNNRKGILFKTVITGIMAVSLYTVFFMNAELVMTWFTKGGIYAALPILTAFLFSFVHGAFTGNIWELLGVNAKVMPPKAATPANDKKKPFAPSFETMNANG